MRTPAVPAPAADAPILNRAYESPYGPPQQDSWQYQPMPAYFNLLHEPPVTYGQSSIASYHIPPPGRHPSEIVTDRVTPHIPWNSQSSTFIASPVLDLNVIPQSRPSSFPSVSWNTSTELAASKTAQENANRARQIIDKQSLRSKEPLKAPKPRTASKLPKAPRAPKPPKELKPPKPPTSRSRKRKQPAETQIADQPTVAPSLRDAPAHIVSYPLNYSSNALSAQEQQVSTSVATPGSTQEQVPRYYDSFPGSWTPQQLQFQNHIPHPVYPYQPQNEHVHPPAYPYPPQNENVYPPGHYSYEKYMRASQLSHDDRHQPITTNYEKYKWSVRLYAIDEHKAGHQFAQSWLGEKFGPYGSQDGLKWHTHVTKGFIQGGDRLTFLVLYNAANPFEWGNAPKSTTSIGCYGFHWYDHSDIHWMTLATDLRATMKELVSNGTLMEVQNWNVDMKAKEKRFHKAYWLAARMSPLRNMLNRAPVDETADEYLLALLDAGQEKKDAGQDEKDTAQDEKDTAQDEEDDFEVSKHHLDNEGFDLSPEESRREWQKCLDIADGEIPEHGWEWIVTGSSEWLDY